jgi:hypothetical protein
MKTNTLLGIVTRGGPNFFDVVHRLAESNHDLPLSLLIYKTKPFDCTLSPTLQASFRDIQIVDDAYFCQTSSGLDPAAHALFSHLDNVALWKSRMLFYAYGKGYDALILWDEDQYPIWTDQSAAYFEPLLQPLAAGYTIASAQRCGYLNGYPLDIHTKVEPQILATLEHCLTMSNEITYPGMFLAPETGFVGHGQAFQGQAKWVEGKWIASGECAYNLRKDVLPLFFQPPKARGEDTFFSTMLNDPAAIYHAPVAHFHDPHGVLLHRSVRKWDEITVEYPQGLEAKFVNLVKGWLSYAPLYLRLEALDWKTKIGEIADALRTLRGPHRAFFEQFQAYRARVEQDYENYQRLGDNWRTLITHLQKQEFSL